MSEAADGQLQLEMVETFASREKQRFLHRDRDIIFGKIFKKKLRTLGVQEVISAL